MSKRCLTLLVGAIGGLALLLTTVVPVLAASPESSEARLPAVLEELVEDGVINSGQAEAIMEKCEPVFNRVERMTNACRQDRQEMKLRVRAQEWSRQGCEEYCESQAGRHGAASDVPASGLRARWAIQPA